MKYTQVSEDK